MLQTQLIKNIDASESLQFEKEKIIVNCKLASVIRRCLRDVFHTLIDSEVDIDKAAYIRMELLKFQSSPYIIPPHLTELLGYRDHQSFSNVWGSDLSNTVLILKEALAVINANGSELMETLVNKVVQEYERLNVEDLKFWCHRAELDSYIDLFKSHQIAIDEHNFVCSLPEYRELDPIETLVVMGPLRQSGWSKKPKVLVSAPRFKKLIQIVWAGSHDEDGFFDDPLVPERDYSSIYTEKIIEVHSSYDDQFTIPWISEEDVDDYQFLKEKPLPNKYSSNAVLLEFPGKKGVLLQPGSQQLIFENSKSHQEFAYRTTGEIEIGNFLLMHDISPQSGAGEYDRVLAPLSEIWKGALEEMYLTRYQQLMYLMGKSAIDLMDHDRAVKKWIQRDGTVVYGPQHKRHFKSLIEDVLTGCLGNNNWQKAWGEIQNSRVKAIQNGKIEHAIVNEVLIKELDSEIELISELCAGGNYFSQKLRQNSELEGEVKFYPIIQKNSGFRGPTEILGQICSIEQFEQFRVEL